MLRLVERYADYNQIAFVAFQRWDGALIDAGTHPVKYLAMHLNTGFASLVWAHSAVAVTTPSAGGKF